MDFDFKAEAATFIERPNRFRVVARLQHDDTLIEAHCPDPGRLRELLVPDARIHVSRARSTARKTAYDLRFVEHPGSGQLVSLDTRLPNKLFEATAGGGRLAAFTQYRTLEREVTVPHSDRAGTRSRIDFRLRDAAGHRRWVEVKSATLVVDGEARFPDAPTERGRRHVLTLAELAANGADATVVFIVQRPDAVQLSPNGETDPAFAAAVRTAAAQGVDFLAYRCELTVTAIEIAGEIPVIIPAADPIP